ncbi:Fic family protein [Patescibacteria group bacterium]|nr:Fic family protein [Patescibacteria group bacterium]MBU1885835.1 Fic family protein [Patescibacteria group bacterium]
MTKNKKNITKNDLVLDRFDQRLEHVSATVILKIGQIDELKGRWITGAQLSPQVLGRLKRSVLITSTGASTRIEGSKLSDEDVEKMMRGISIQKFTDRDKQEVKGYYELLENVFNSWKTLRFNESTVKHFHQELLKHVDKDQRHRGDYKKQENKVHMVNEVGESVGILFDTTVAYLTPKEMQELIEWTNNAFFEKKYHVLLIVANFLVEFLKIHPFQDGNGRLSRVLTNLLLLKEGYGYMSYVSHEKLVEDNKSEYYIALRKSQKTMGSKKEDITPWLEFFFTILIKQVKMAEELLSKENIEKLLSVKQLIVWQYLQNIEEVSTGELVKKTKIPRATIKQALDRLLQFKKIERIGLGRSARYRRL